MMEVVMIKKIFWIVILLVMTACTIMFSEQLDFTKPEDATATLEPFEPTDGMVSLSEAVNSASSTMSEIEFPTPGDVPIDAALEKTITAAEVNPTVTYKFGVQEGSPAYLANFNYLDRGCEWQGVAGQVFNKYNEPVKYLIVKVFGTWNGQEVSQFAVTGMLEGKAYGKGSYEIELGSVAVDSTDPLYIQVFKSDGTPLSEPFPFTTKAKCNRNLVLINFVRN
jgi:hypothetical protein